MPLRAIAEVNLAAIERNVNLLRSKLAPHGRLCAVVKADGYGHGAVPVARAALQAGADQLAVATAMEALELRDAGVAGPVLIMGAISADELPQALSARAEVTAWDAGFVEVLARAAANQAEPTRVHVKLDTGLGRLGTRDPELAVAAAQAVQAASPALELAGAMTHFATADEDLEFVAEQLRTFAPFVERLRAMSPDLIAHAANSAATLRVPESHLDMVRCGIALYGCDPMNEDPLPLGLEPALSLSSYVAAVKQAEPGQSAGYGRRFIARRPTWLGTIPIGYGDGVSRALSNNCDVLIAGHRFPLVGTVSMDNITVDLGSTPAVAVGDPAVLIGCDGSERQTAEQIARREGTISYEVLCGITCRVPRRYNRDGIPA
jgi:alanine racemase